MNRLKFLGLDLLTGSYSEAAWHIASNTFCNESAAVPRIFVHLNHHCLYSLRKVDGLLNTLHERSDIFAEGIALKTLIWLRHGIWIADVNGTDLFPAFLNLHASRNVRIYLVGDLPGVAEEAARRIAQRWQHAQLVGTHHGYFTPDQADSMCAEINAANADLLLLGLGCPLQESTALAWAEHLNCRAIWTVGALLGFVSGRVPRAPLAVRRARLEWLYRFLREPRRQYKRIFVAFPWCAWRSLIGTPVVHRTLGFWGNPVDRLLKRSHEENYL